MFWLGVIDIVCVNVSWELGAVTPYKLFVMLLTSTGISKQVTLLTSVR